MWFNLQSTLTGERFQTLSRRVDRLQDLLRKIQDENEQDRHQDFQDFAHATGNGLAEVFRADGSRAFPSPSSAARAFSWPAVNSGGPERFLRINSGGQSYWVLARPFSLGGQSLLLMAAAPEAGNLLVLNRFLAWIAGLGANPVAGLVGGRLLGRTKGTETGGHASRPRCNRSALETFPGDCPWPAQAMNCNGSLKPAMPCWRAWNPPSTELSSLPPTLRMNFALRYPSPGRWRKLP